MTRAYTPTLPLKNIPADWTRALIGRWAEGEYLTGTGENTPDRIWLRDQTYAGPYSPKKQVYKKSQEGIYTEVGNWTSGYTANGYRMIRFADVLLLKAECEAWTGTDDLGLGEVNALRSRAANPDGFVKETDGSTPAANYVIGLYPFLPRLQVRQKGHQIRAKA